MELRDGGGPRPHALPPLRAARGDREAFGHERGGHRHRLGPGVRPAAGGLPHPHRRAAAPRHGCRLGHAARRHRQGDAGRHGGHGELGRAVLLAPAWLAGVGGLPSGPAGGRRLARPAEPAVDVALRRSLELRSRHRPRRRGHRVRHPVRPGERDPRPLLGPAPADLHLGRRIHGDRRSADAAEHPAEPADAHRLPRGPQRPAARRGRRHALRVAQRTGDPRVRLHRHGGRLPGQRPGAARPPSGGGGRATRITTRPAGCSSSSWRTARSARSPSTGPSR